MIRCLRVVAVAAAVVLVTASVAEAQRQGRGRGPGFGGFGRGLDSVALLRIEKVQAALGLDLVQGDQIHVIQDEMRAAQREMFAELQGQDLTREERRERFGEMRDKMEKVTDDAREKVHGVLSQSQRDRLDQISLQVRGPAALADEQVAAKLELSEAQLAELETIRQEGREAARELFQSQRGGNVDRDAMREKFQELQAAQTEKTLAALTDSQREAFDAMQGEKLELTPEDMRGAFGGFGGGFGGQGRGGRERGGRGQDNQ